MTGSIPEFRVSRGIHADLVRELATQIVTGGIRPGVQLDLEAVAAQARVSRTVLREALKTLEAKGLVEARPRWGTRVRDQTSWNMLDPDIIAWFGEFRVEADFLDELAIVREAIEPAAARDAAIKGSEDDIAKISSAFEAFAHSVAEEVDRIVDCDVAFHVTILEASHNRFLRQMAPLLSAALRGRDRLVLSDRRQRQPARLMVDEHRQVLEAIQQRAPDDAERLMRALTQQARKDAESAVKANPRRPREA
jgi:DNA-binding FadR family transcriptional regulator